MNNGYWGTFILMVIGLLGALWLETGLPTTRSFELLLILLAIIIGGIVLVGVRAAHGWAWRLAVVYFAVLMLNAALVMLGVSNHIIAFFLATTAPLFGMLLALMHFSQPIDVTQPAQPAQVTSPPSASKTRAKSKKR